MMPLAFDLVRHLSELQDGTSAHVNTVDPGPEAEAEMATENTQALRIASIFVILAAGVIGGIPPLFLKVWSSGAQVAKQPDLLVGGLPARNRGSVEGRTQAPAAHAPMCLSVLIT